MTSQHVIKRLKHLDEFIIAPTTTHELALMWNAFIDAELFVYTTIGLTPAKAHVDFFKGIHEDFVIFSKGSLSEISYRDLMSIHSNFTNISYWFFKEVTNY